MTIPSQVVITDASPTTPVPPQFVEDVSQGEDDQEKLLLNIYDEMRNRQRNNLLNDKKMRYDAFFGATEAPVAEAVVDADCNSSTSSGSSSQGVTRLDDKRRCLAISCILDESADCQWTDAYYSLQKKLHEQFDDTKHLRFGQIVNIPGSDVTKKTEERNGNGLVTGQLHWTLMQLVGFNDYDFEIPHAGVVSDNESDSESEYTTKDYLDCVQNSLMQDGGFNEAITIKYIGVIAVTTGLLMVGIPVNTKPNFNINTARDQVRKNLVENHLPLKEPFVNDIVHSTLFRTCTENKTINEDNYLRILEIAKEFENVDLGTVTVNKLQIGPASWRMLHNEMVDTPPFRQWTLPTST